MDFDLLEARLSRVLFPTPDCRRAIEEETDALELVKLQEGFIEAIKQVLYLFEFDSKSYRDIREVLISCQWFQYEVEHFRLAPISSDDAKSRLARMLEVVDKSKVFLDLLASCEHEEDRPTLPAPAPPAPATDNSTDIDSDSDYLLMTKKVARQKLRLIDRTFRDKIQKGKIRHRKVAENVKWIKIHRDELPK